MSAALCRKSTYQGRSQDFALEGGHPASWQTIYLYRVCVRACVRAVVRSCGRAVVRSCVRSCVRACGRACMRSCVRPCVRACGRACVRACVRACAFYIFLCAQSSVGNKKYSYMPQLDVHKHVVCRIHYCIYYL